MSVESEEVIEVEVPSNIDPSEVEVDVESVGQAASVAAEPAPAANQEEEYSTRVKKRISQEVAKRHDAERRAAAVEEKIIKLQQAYHQAQDNAVTSGESAIEAQKTALQRDYTDAYNNGETDKMFDVQDRLSKLTFQQSEFAKHKEDNNRFREAGKERQTQRQEEVVQQQPAREPEVKAVDWARQNKWFGQDEAMTGAAYAIHRRLVNTEGYDTTTDDYFKELDNRLKSAFPSKFNKRNANSSPVAAVTGKSVTSKRVKLNQAQLDVCKRLGVTPEQYARYVD